MQEHDVDDGRTHGHRSDQPGTGWVAVLTRLDASGDPMVASAQGRELSDRVRATAPSGIGVELIGPTPGDARQLGLLISSPDLTLLSRWIESQAAVEAIRALNEMSGAPVSINSQGGVPSAEFPMSYVVTYTVPSACRPRFQQWQPKMVAAHLDAAGFVGAEYHAPLSSDEHDWTVVVRFATDADVASWRASERRLQLVDELAAIVDDLEIGRARLSWAGWFPAPRAETPHRPRRWKQALATVLPLYPTVMLAATHLAPRLGSDGWGWPGWLVTFVVVSTAVSTLTWLLMPRVTKILQPWLLPAPDQSPRRDLGWTLLVLTMIGGLVTLFAITT